MGVQRGENITQVVVARPPVGEGRKHRSKPSFFSSKNRQHDKSRISSKGQVTLPDCR
jgi:hypothetical protein